jgi:hypothetical protein
VVVELGKTEVLVGEVAETGERVVDADDAGLEGLEQVSEPGFVDGGIPPRVW